jgi:hypothetical protein
MVELVEFDDAKEYGKEVRRKPGMRAGMGLEEFRSAYFRTRDRPSRVRFACTSKVTTKVGAPAS